MKICIQTLGIMFIAASLSYGQDAPKKEGERHPEPRKIFKKLDADNNATVSMDEFKASPRGQKNPEKAAEIFKKIDANGNGGLSLGEFKSHTPAHPPGKKHGKKGAPKGQCTPKKEGKRHPEPRKIFKKLDADGNGGLSLEEFKSHLTAHPPRRPGKKGAPKGE